VKSRREALTSRGGNANLQNRQRHKELARAFGRDGVDGMEGEEEEKREREREREGLRGCVRKALKRDTLGGASCGGEEFEEVTGGTLKSLRALVFCLWLVLAV